MYTTWWLQTSVLERLVASGSVLTIMKGQLAITEVGLYSRLGRHSHFPSAAAGRKFFPRIYNNQHPIQVIPALFAPRFDGRTVRVVY